MRRQAASAPARMDADPSQSPSSRWRNPAPSKVQVRLWSIYFGTALLITSFFDTMCVLPHPMDNLPGGLGEPQNDNIKALTQSDIRQMYHERLHKWKDFAERHMKSIEKGDPDALKLLEQEVPERSCRNCSSSPMCRLAEASSKERYSARVNTRRSGTAVMHFGLILRDRLVHGSGYYDVAQLFRRELSKMRKKREAKGEAPPTEEDVCYKIVQSASQSNEFWNATANIRSTLFGYEIGYVIEAVCDWLLLGVAVSLAVFVLYVAVNISRQFSVNNRRD